MNSRLLRCTECGVVAMLSGEDQTCVCGATLPEPAPYL